MRLPQLVKTFLLGVVKNVKISCSLTVFAAKVKIVCADVGDSRTSWSEDEG